MKRKDPKIISVIYTDPFDGALIAESHYSFNKRWSAKSVYSRHIKKMKNALRTISSHILEGRTPDVEIKFL